MFISVRNKRILLSCSDDKIIFNFFFWKITFLSENSGYCSIATFHFFSIKTLKTFNSFKWLLESLCYDCDWYISLQEVLIQFNNFVLLYSLITMSGTAFSKTISSISSESNITFISQNWLSFAFLRILSWL